LEANLQNLLGKVKSGTYRAPPIRRVHIPKGTGSDTRAIGIPTLEDKILQRAVSMVLEAIYEQDFLECSYGFRLGRSTHQLLEDLWKQLMNMGGGYVIEVDVQKFFDTLDHGHLLEILSHRMRDGVLTRLIGKWLNAGVMEDGHVSYPSGGTPQGGVISPLLANIFLHEVIDEWFEKTVKPCLLGPGHLYRFADDIIIVLGNDRDAERVMNVLPYRFGKFGLKLHPDKTRSSHFVPGKENSSFNLLGFTHYWGKSRRGNWAVKRKTESGRFGAAIKRIGKWCRENRPRPIRDQHRMLCAKLRGDNAYYGITGNSAGLSRFCHEVGLLWIKWISRRSRKAPKSWEKLKEILHGFPLPKPIPIHSVLRSAANI
jgi:RNA-directed DNA polymerase